MKVMEYGKVEYWCFRDIRINTKIIIEDGMTGSIIINDILNSEDAEGIGIINILYHTVEIEYRQNRVINNDIYPIIDGLSYIVYHRMEKPKVIHEEKYSNSIQKTRIC